MSDAITPLEVAEWSAFADLYRGATPDVVEECGLVVSGMNDGVVLAATRLDVLALNRAVGFGLRRRPFDEDLASLVAAFETIGSPRFFVQVAPVEASADLGDRLEALGLRH